MPGISLCLPAFVAAVLGFATLSATPEPAAVLASEPREPAPEPYRLPDTEVRPIRSGILGRDYRLLVSLPPEYAKTTRVYPVLFVTDADYSFPLIRSIGRRLGTEEPEVNDYVLIGLSYAQGDSPGYSRRRDYTPTPNGENPGVLDPASGKPYVYGEAEGYRRFIAEEVFPLVRRSYRVDMARAIYAGHSYGGLLGAHILLTEPKMFSRYILSSPSLWYDERWIFRRLQAYLASHDDLPAKVLLPIGSFETVRPESDDPRYHKERDMVADVLDFEKRLRGRGYPGLEIRSMVIEDEDHLSVFPASITRGLRWALAEATPR